MKVLVLVALFLCVQAAFGSFRHHHHHKPSNSNSKVSSDHGSCSYQTDKGSYDLRLMVRDIDGKDWELKDQATQASFFFSPCGGVHTEKCDKDAAMCLVNQDQAVDFGRADNISWAEHPNGGVEITYGNGDACPNGVPRKTLVQLTCSKPTTDKDTHRTVITDFEVLPCQITLKMTSPYGCPVEELCSVYNEEECQASEGLCGWKNDACVYQSVSCFQVGRHHLPLGAFVGIIAAVPLLLLTCIACCCCCRRRRMRKLQQQTELPTINKKSKKAKKAEEEVVEAGIPETQFIYQPLQQYPGQYAQQGMAFPMVQLMPMQVAPSIQNE